MLETNEVSNYQKKKKLCSQIAFLQKQQEQKTKKQTPKTFYNGNR